MKKSEMITHIAEEIKDMVNARAYSRENDDRYYQRRAAGLLDMLLGFGMLPPEIEEKVADNEYGCIEEGYRTVMVSKWEEENHD